MRAARRRVIWHSLAEEDLTRAYLFIEADSPIAAERLLDAVERAVRLLQENPAAGHRWEFHSPHAQGLRSLGVKGFQNYLIFYRGDGDDLEIIRFIHGSRDFPRLVED